MKSFFSNTAALCYTLGMKHASCCLLALALALLPLHAQELPPLSLVNLPEGLEIPACACTGSSRWTDDHELRRCSAFTLCYRESYELAEWVAYELTREELAKNVRRSNAFRPDPAISTGSADLEDYRGSGYDRGHLAPSGDMLFDAQANSESFLLSNITPQLASFNSGIWNELENQVRRWAERYGRVYVITGPVLEKPAGDYEHIGHNLVAVPEYFYKVVLTPVYRDESDAESPEDCEKLIASAFIIPNKKCRGSFWKYRVPLREAERRTGLDFFPLLDAQEAAAAFLSD